MLLPPPQATAKSIASDARNNKLSNEAGFRRCPLKGTKTSAATNSEPASTLILDGRNSAEPLCGPVVLMVSIVVTTFPFVLSVEGLKSQLASTGKP